MSDRPILFSGPLVKAILDGWKTQTRRLVKPQPKLKNEITRITDMRPGFVDSSNEAFRCLYGEPGDRLWVRETWADVNSEGGPSLIYRADGTLRSWHDFSEVFGEDYGAGPSFDYDAYPGDYTMWWSDLLYREERGCKEDHHWKSPYHMPRWASRITLEVTGLRVERLQDITEEDARAEGVSHTTKSPFPSDGGRFLYKGAFACAWDRINGKRASWESNPWVWVIDFKRVDS